jgi:outer membrane protein assembly factor BamD
MKKKIGIAFLTLVMFALFSGCSKTVEEYNKPAIYWYSKMIHHIANDDLEKADDYYSSLQGEHIGSPLLPKATLMLAVAHLDDEEYLLSTYFFDEYIKRYADESQKEFAEYMKIKAKYKALPNPRRDQVLINQAINEALRFKNNYPFSDYFAYVDTMLTRLYMADAVLNETIASLYDRIDKPKSAEYYRDLKPQPWIDWNITSRAVAPWYRSWFEGDGTGSWYGFLVPDTRSVVSRNSVNEDTNRTK